MNYKNIVLSTDIHGLEIERGGREFSIPVKIENGSGEDLLSSQDTYITFHVVSSDGEMLRWDGERTEIALLADRTEVVNVIGTVPDEAGEYFFQIDIVQEGEEWYSSREMDVLGIPVKVLQTGSKCHDQLKEELKRQKEIDEELSRILNTGGGIRCRHLMCG